MKTSTLAEYIKARKSNSIKLHLGCGGERWRDFINVDLYAQDDSRHDSSRSGCVAELIADMRDLGLPDCSVDEIFTTHTIDHFPRWEAVRMFEDWHRMLKFDGVLVIEAADFWRCILWLFHPRREKRRLARSQFYGNQWDEIDYETHRYLWSAKELTGILREIGFKSVMFHHKTLTHHPGRDMHVRAQK
jgi:predicted SAM-dependent methyltransferase